MTHLRAGPPLNDANLKRESFFWNALLGLVCRVKTGWLAMTLEFPGDRATKGAGDGAQLLRTQCSQQGLPSLNSTTVNQMVIVTVYIYIHIN